MTFALEDYGTRLRRAAFAFLDSLESAMPVSQVELATFSFEGVPIRLMATQQGIWKPRQLDAALSMRTVFSASPDERPYADEEGSDGFLRYKWRGTDPAQADNIALRSAMRQGLPLIWFQGVARALYIPIYPVYLAAEEAALHQFVVAFERDAVALRRDLLDQDPATLRAYAERVVQVRLHQRVFRERVLLAYETRCAVCNLQHRELLDAAHVLGDAAGGLPVVTNGIAMCKIHHAAYDADIFGISPEYRLGVRPDVLAESDGPTLRYALQAIDQNSLKLPRERAARPDPELLAQRWQEFLAAS
jgi:putative restriction endonuclease